MTEVVRRGGGTCASTGSTGARGGPPKSEKPHMNAPLATGPIHTHTRNATVAFDRPMCACGALVCAQLSAA
jgi:hypothetical protein